MALWGWVEGFLELMPFTNRPIIEFDAYLAAAFDLCTDALLVYGFADIFFIFGDESDVANIIIYMGRRIFYW